MNKPTKKEAALIATIGVQAVAGVYCLHRASVWKLSFKKDGSHG